MAPLVTNSAICGQPQEELMNFKPLTFHAERQMSTTTEKIQSKKSTLLSRLKSVNNNLFLVTNIIF